MAGAERLEDHVGPHAPAGWSGRACYFTLVADLKMGRVVWIGDGKDENHDRSACAAAYPVA